MHFLQYEIIPDLVQGVHIESQSIPSLLNICFRSLRVSDQNYHNSKLCFDSSLHPIHRLENTIL